MLRVLIRSTLVVIVLLFLGGSSLWWGLQAPARARVPPAGGVITGVTTVEPGRSRLDAQAIVIRGSRIAEVRPATDAELSASSPYSGGFALPGLIDMHVHQPTAFGGLADYFALLYLEHGVTSVRDTGNFYPDILALRSDIARGLLPGPRIFTCGPMIDGDPPRWDSAAVARTAEEGRDVVERLAAEGVDCIKVYTGLKPEVLASVRRAARDVGLPVIGHIPEGIAFEAARLDDVQHLTGVPDQQHLPAGSNPMLAGWAELTDERIAFVARTSIEQGVAHTPTLTFLDSNSRRDRHSELLNTPGTFLLPRVLRDVFWIPRKQIRLGGERTPETYSGLRVAFEASKQAVSELHAAGVRIHAGTDTGNPFVVPGASLHQELELLVAAGLSLPDAWASATTVPGEFLPESRLGRIEAGAPADLLIFSEDPTQSLEALASLQLVVANGRMYRRELLDREVARYQAHYHGFIWDRVVPLIARMLR